MPFLDEVITRSSKIAKKLNKVLPQLRAQKEAAEAQRISKLINKSLKQRDSINSTDRVAIHEIQTTLKQVEKSVENVLQSVKRVEEQTFENPFGLKNILFTSMAFYGGVRLRWDVLKESKAEELKDLRTEIEKNPELQNIAKALKKKEDSEDAIVIYVDNFELNSIKHENQIIKLEKLEVEYEGIKEDLNRIDFIPNKCLEALRFTIKELSK